MAEPNYDCIVIFLAWQVFFSPYDKSLFTKHFFETAPYKTICKKSEDENFNNQTDKFDLKSWLDAIQSNIE